MVQQIDTVLSIAARLSGIIALLSVFFEVSKIKLNPLTALFEWIGKRINKRTEEHLDEIQKQVKELENKMEEVDVKVDHSDMNRLRWEIMNFTNECRNKRRHSKDQFEHVIESFQEYHDIIDRSGDTNGVLDASYKYIMELYDKCLREDDFL